MSMSVDEHERRRAWCGAWSAPSSCVLVHYTWCMGGNSAGCVRVCFFCLKRRKTTNNPSSLALFFIALIVPSSSSFFFLHHFFHTYTFTIDTPSRPDGHSYQTASSFSSSATCPDPVSLRGRPHPCPLLLLCRASTVASPLSYPLLPYLPRCRSTKLRQFPFFSCLLHPRLLLLATTFLHNPSWHLKNLSTHRLPQYAPPNLPHFLQITLSKMSSTRPNRYLLRNLPRQQQHYRLTPPPNYPIPSPSP